MDDTTKQVTLVNGKAGDHVKPTACMYFIFELCMRRLLTVYVAATFKDEYFGVTGNQTGGKTSITFSRKLASSDPSGYNFLQSGISLLWAIASTDNINVQHDTSDVVNINFLTVSFAILNCSKLILSLREKQNQSPTTKSFTECLWFCVWDS